MSVTGHESEVVRGAVGDGALSPTRAVLVEPDAGGDAVEVLVGEPAARRRVRCRVGSMAGACPGRIAWLAAVSAAGASSSCAPSGSGADWVDVRRDRLGAAAGGPALPRGGKTRAGLPRARETRAEA